MGGGSTVDTLDGPHPLDCLCDANVILDELEETGRRQHCHCQEEALCDRRQHLAKHHRPDVVRHHALQAPVEDEGDRTQRHFISQEVTDSLPGN